MILIGAILGWAGSFLLPTPYQAEAEIFVAFNGDVFARNPDDYKNWHIGELSAFIQSEAVLQQTLEDLQAQNPVWADYHVADLRPQLNNYWRNTGKWRLVARAETAEEAIQLVEAWERASLGHVIQAVEHANKLIAISPQLQTVSDLRAKFEARLIELDQVEIALQELQKKLRTGDSQPLNVRERWRLQSLLARAVLNDSMGKDILENAPPADAISFEYLPWVEPALVYVDDQQLILKEQIAQLANQFEELSAEWSEEFSASHGLSAYLRVEQLSPTDTPVKPIRPTSSMMLVGATIGFLAWVLIWIGRLNLMKK